MPEADFYIRQNDTASTIADTLKDEAGAPVNIAGATIRFHLAPTGDATVTLDVSASNDQIGDGSDGSRGNVSYAWAVAAPAPALYLGEWQVTYTGGAVQTFPNDRYVLVRVTAEVA